MSYLAGGVEVDFAGGKTALTDLTANIDGKSVRSVTGELEWNYADGICTLDAPKVAAM